MFEKLRQSLEDLANARTARPEERRLAAARMKESLVLARVALEDLRKAAEQTRGRLAAERRELETVLRRKSLAAGIADAETVTIAERFERQHAERVAVLERKLEAQENELALAEREVQEMTSELRAAISGATPATGTSSVGSGASSQGAEPAGAEGAPRDELGDAIDALDRQRRRAANEAAADEKLAELKRRMGK